MNVMNVKGEYWIEARQCLNLMCHMLPACLPSSLLRAAVAGAPPCFSLSKPARAGLIAMKAQFPSSNLQSPWNMQHYDRKEPKEKKRERQLRVAGALNHTCVYVQSVYVCVCVCCQVTDCKGRAKGSAGSTGILLNALQAGCKKGALAYMIIMIIIIIFITILLMQFTAALCAALVYGPSSLKMQAVQKCCLLLRAGLFNSCTASSALLLRVVGTSWPISCVYSYSCES